MEKLIEEFLDDMRAEAKMIIIDDIQFFAGKNAIQCEFKNVLEMDKVIIVSGVDESERFPLDEFVVNMPQLLIFQALIS